MSEAAEPINTVGCGQDILVDRSVSGRRWVLRRSDERAGLALSQRLGIPEIVGRVMAARGIDLDAAEQFLDPTLRDALPDPATLIGMDVAAERLAKAIRDGEPIAIFGDYDVDGATSSAFWRGFFPNWACPPGFISPIVFLRAMARRHRPCCGCVLRGSAW